jgi:hypothetical protein
MTHQSEGRLPESAPAGASIPASARILPFERPRSELQRAIQERAQEAIDIDRDREREVKRPQPLKWLIITALALIPVILIFAAVDGFLRAFYRINQAYSSPATQNAQPQASEPTQSSEPGVVLLQPLGEQSAPTDEAASPQPAPPAQSPQTKDQ